LVALLTTLKGLPSGYSKDMQEDKRALFDAVDTLMLVLPAAAGALGELTFRRDRMQGAVSSAMMATDVADYLVARGVAFRDAHRAVGVLIRMADAQGVELHELPFAEYATVHPDFAIDVFESLSPRRSVERRNIEGGTGPDALRVQLVAARAALAPPRETPRGNGVVIASR
jgi:argininosuccinate lyase